MLAYEKNQKLKRRHRGTISRITINRELEIAFSKTDNEMNELNELK